MSVNVPPLVITTCVSGILGWLIKLLLDMLKDYIESSKQWRAKMDDRMTKQSEEMERERAETEAKRASEAEWRIEVSKRIESQDTKIHAILEAQCTQMRSDLVHKAHRYIDDLGCASIEEKDAFNAEYDDYCEICEQYEIKNNFVATLAKQVMDLPDRPTK